MNKEEIELIIEENKQLKGRIERMKEPMVKLAEILETGLPPHKEAGDLLIDIAKIIGDIED